MNVTVRNVITSMRLISALDWAEFFESVSLVDAALRADSDFAADGFPHARSLSACDRRAGARIRPHRNSKSRVARLPPPDARAPEPPNRRR